MSWELILGLYVAGTIATGIVLYLATHLGIRWQRELPKVPIHESLVVLRQRLEEKQVEFDELQEELFQAKNVILEAKQKRDWLERNEDHIRDLERKADQLREVEDKLASAIDEHDKMLESVQELEVRRAALEAKLMGEEDIVARLDELRQERALLQAEVASAGTELNRLKDQLQVLQSELGEVEVATVAARELKSKLMDEHARLQADVSQMEVERDHLQAQIQRLTEERMSVAPPEAATVAERTAALWSPPVIKPMPHARPADLLETQALEGALGRIRQSGLLFHDRAVCAFHTGLKVARETPLLVLAGISGTGKSALPRRYAEVMGMHFHNVAVQPGWDSPLDLVGFYNHLEGRFKPTELTRALVQMDPIGARNARWPGESSDRTDLSNELLIVLLDEMNLARVEYYFSDFLSRLEIRRDVNPHSERERRLAEVQLEIGRGDGGAGQSVPLFVAENVLFVGTMNEDESTQALSDKVVDRSNVMRFGRPSTLVAAGDLGASVEPASLSYATWRRWRDEADPLTGDALRDVNEFIDKSNDLLDAVGRPFAHRTAQTMREYARQYPRISHDALSLALADQLEMQVLPRMRGIDMEGGNGRDSLTGVVQLAEKLGDAELERAVSNAMERSVDQFIWSGVDRKVDESSG